MEFLKNLLQKFLGPTRILFPTILIFGTITAATLLLWRLDVLPGTFRPVFFFAAAVGALVGYFSAGRSRSVLRLVIAGVTTVISFAILYFYYHSLEGISASILVGLVLLLGVQFGSLYYAVKVAMNRGLN